MILQKQNLGVVVTGVYLNNSFIAATGDEWCDKCQLYHFPVVDTTPGKMSRIYFLIHKSSK